MFYAQSTAKGDIRSFFFFFFFFFSVRRWPLTSSARYQEQNKMYSYHNTAGGQKKNQALYTQFSNTYRLETRDLCHHRNSSSTLSFYARQILSKWRTLHSLKPPVIVDQRQEPNSFQSSTATMVARDKRCHTTIKCSSTVYFAPISSSTVYFAPISSSTAYFAPINSSTAYFAPISSSTAYFAPISSSTVYFAPISSSTAYVAPISSSTAYFAPISPQAPVHAHSQSVLYSRLDVISCRAGTTDQSLVSRRLANAKRTRPLLQAPTNKQLRASLDN